MADAPKRKRLEKVQQDNLPVSNQKFYCYRCGMAFSRQKGYFPVSHSPMYRGIGYLPFAMTVSIRCLMSIGNRLEAIVKLCVDCV